MPDTPIADRIDRNDLAKLLREADGRYIFDDQRFTADIPIESYQAQADAILAAGYRKVSADPDTVERVGQAVFDEVKKYQVPSEPFRAGQVGSMGATVHDVGRAAINAIGGGQ